MENNLSFYGVGYRLIVVVNVYGFIKSFKYKLLTY